MMDGKDKADIIVALRECAGALEQGHPDALTLLQALGTEMLVLGLKNGPALASVPEDQVEALVRREVFAVADSIASFHQHKVTEVEILNARLVRQFDPAMAWNEAINRAIAAKKAKREEVIDLTPPQRFMFETYQVPTTMKALRSA